MTEHNSPSQKQITRELVDATAEARTASGVTIRLNEVYSLGYNDALDALTRVIHGECRCIEAYKSRGLEDPSCQVHDVEGYIEDMRHAT